MHEMIIKRVRVRNFRSIKDETLSCDELTVLVGPNGAGKSSFLKALDMFYLSSAFYDVGDFYNENTSQDIIITVTYTNLSDAERELFQKYIEGDELTVEKVMVWPHSKRNQRYHGASLKNSDFDAFRSAGGPNLRAEYNLLKEGAYTALSKYTNKGNAEEALRKWEESNPDRCTRQRDDGQFFGFTEVGGARLERFTRFIFVPAVRDASEDAEEGKGSPLTEIMDLVVRSALQGREDIQELRERTQREYEIIMDPGNLSELRELEHSLNTILKTYVPEAEVDLVWYSSRAIDLPPPSASIKLVEDDYSALVQSCGHGLQRAYILTMLQYLAQVQTRSRTAEDDTGIESSDESPNFLIAIEEPELYQHPNRQRHMAKVFLKLASGSIEGVAQSTQVLYSTHSPLFVDIRRFNNVRRLCKVPSILGEPKKTTVVSTTLDEVAAVIGKADGKIEGEYSGATLQPRLQTLMTPWMNEGFFADVAVLVEGEEDRAILLGVAQSMEYDLESLGVSVIPCMGKNNLDRPTVIFQQLGIPVYTVWDTDKGNNEAHPKDNHKLLRLMNEVGEDWPHKVTNKFACFESTLSTTLQEEIGQGLFDKELDDCCKRWSLSKKKQAKKNPMVIQEILAKAKAKGCTSGTVEEVINRIVRLR
jgi:predicted ATP-dependent endonuclease of OLD family